MTDVITLIGYFLLGLLIVLLLVGGLLVSLWALREHRRRQAYARTGTSHIDLYFDEHFENIIRNFDLVSVSRFDSWSHDISTRLEGLGRDIEVLGNTRTEFNVRMNKLEKRISALE